MGFETVILIGLIVGHGVLLVFTILELISKWL